MTSIVTDHVHSTREGNVFTGVGDSVDKERGYPDKVSLPPPIPVAKSGLARGLWPVLSRDVNGRPVLFSVLVHCPGGFRSMSR